MEVPLCAAVRLFGFDWSRISEVLGVSANACKKRWSLFRSSYLPLSHLLHPLPPVASFPVVGGSFPLVVPCGRGLQRSTSGGRPWNFAVRSGKTGRKLTSRQLDLVRLWNLHDTDGSAMMLCNLKEHCAIAGAGTTFGPFLESRKEGVMMGVILPGTVQ